MVKKQTAGRDNLGTFAPKFAQLNDDVLFGEVWSREEELAPHTRSLLTISALISGGNFEQLTAHLTIGKEKRDHCRGNCRSNHSSGFLCWLAQSLVCF